MESLHVVVSGRVQGVGFRYHTQDKALELGLAGWVRNLADGRVEALFEGPRADLEVMLAWLHQGPAFSRVTHVSPAWGVAQGREGFRIVG